MISHQQVPHRSLEYQTDKQTSKQQTSVSDGLYFGEYVDVLTDDKSLTTS